VTGSFVSATFGPGEPGETKLTSTGLSDLFVAKYKADGALAWARRAGGKDNVSGSGVAVLSDGSAVVAGSFMISATFGPGEPGETILTSPGSYEIFVAKYKPDGALAWARRAGGTDADLGWGVAVLSDGSAVVTGSFSGIATFGPGEPGETKLTPPGMFVAKFAP
jgi:hypothetical protein